MTDDTPVNNDTLRQERERLEQEIIDLERRLETTHEESGGNSPDDNSQEATRDYIDRALIGEQIEVRRKRVVEIEALLAQTT